ncbi:MAG: hypothetical protein D6726_09615 [Nitrospirae bacterium]|nr:MAG: hypothetical protein D6726_09615 [Nitrospirota bacterium]
MNRIYLQIIDNPFEDLVYSETSYDEGATNHALAEELQTSFDIQYPNMVHVEYIDLFLEDESRFPEIREMLSHGLLRLPVILINGNPFLHGGISYQIIMEEVEKILSAGPLH